jgi:hypothetical protein
MEDARMAKYRVPAFLHVAVDGAERDMAFDKAMGDENLRGQVVAMALTEIEDWLDRWFATLEYAVEAYDDVLAAETMPLAIAMQDFRMKLGHRWPTWPNWMHHAQDDASDSYSDSDTDHPNDTEQRQ